MVVSKEELQVLLTARDNLTKVLDGAGVSVDDFERKVKKGSKEAGKSFNDADQQAAKLGLSLKDVAKSAVGLGIAYQGLRVLKGAIADAKLFDAAMTEVSTVVDTTKVDIDALGASVRRLAVDLAAPEDVVARGLYQAISGGITDTADALKVVAEGGRLARAGFTETSLGVDLLTTSINVFKTPIEDVASLSDSFFKAVELGKTTIPELSAALGKVAQPAANLGLTLDETLAALIQITKGGVSTAEAVTQLRAALTAFSVGAERQEQILGSGVKVLGAQQFAAKGLAQAFNDVRVATRDLGQDGLTRLLGSSEAVNAVLALTGDNAAGLADTMGQLEEKAGAAATALRKVEDSDTGKIEAFNNALSISASIIGGALLTNSVELADQWTEATEAGAGLVEIAEKVAAGIGLVGSSAQSAMALLQIALALGEASVLGLGEAIDKVSGGTLDLVSEEDIAANTDRIRRLTLGLIDSSEETRRSLQGLGVNVDTFLPDSLRGDVTRRLEEVRASVERFAQDLDIAGDAREIIFTAGIDEAELDRLQTRLASVGDGIDVGSNLLEGLRRQVDRANFALRLGLEVDPAALQDLERDLASLASTAPDTLALGFDLTGARSALDGLDLSALELADADEGKRRLEALQRGAEEAAAQFRGLAGSTAGIAQGLAATLAEQLESLQSLTGAEREAAEARARELAKSQAGAQQTAAEFEAQAGILEKVAGLYGDILAVIPEGVAESVIPEGLLARAEVLRQTIQSIGPEPAPRAEDPVQGPELPDPEAEIQAARELLDLTRQRIQILSAMPASEQQALELLQRRAEAELNLVRVQVEEGTRSEEFQAEFTAARLASLDEEIEKVRARYQAERDEQAKTGDGSDAPRLPVDPETFGEGFVAAKDEMLEFFDAARLGGDTFSALEGNASSFFADLIGQTQSAGQSFSDFKDGLIRDLSAIAAKFLATQFISALFPGPAPAKDGKTFSGGIETSALGNVYPYAAGGRPGPGGRSIERRGQQGNPFLNQIVGRPTLAPSILFGEAGEEAIMPLEGPGQGKGAAVVGDPTGLLPDRIPVKRGADGVLGIDGSFAASFFRDLGSLFERPERFDMGGVFGGTGGGGSSSASPVASASSGGGGRGGDVVFNITLHSQRTGGGGGDNAYMTGEAREQIKGAVESIIRTSPNIQRLIRSLN